MMTPTAVTPEQHGRSLGNVSVSIIGCDNKISRFYFLVAPAFEDRRCTVHANLQAINRNYQLSVCIIPTIKHRAKNNSIDNQTGLGNRYDMTST